MLKGKRPAYRTTLTLVTLLTTAATYGQKKVSEFKPCSVTTEYIFEQAPFKSAHASTVVELSDGNIAAAWFGGDHEGADDVCIWMSTRDPKGWSPPVRIADGVQSDKKQYPCWNPVLFRIGNKLYLHYKIGPNPREWWAQYKVSTDNGRTWSAAQSLPAGYLGPIKNKPIKLWNGTILYPSSTESRDEKHWCIHIEGSDVTLQKWWKVEIPCDTFQVIQPTLLKYGAWEKIDNSRCPIRLLARSKHNVVVESWSYDDGKTWSPLKPTAIPNPNSGIDAVTLPSAFQVLVYNPLPAGKEWWEGRSVLKIAGLLNDALEDFYTFEEHPKGEYSYPAIIVDGNGIVHITYTDNRTRIKYVRMDIKVPSHMR